MGVERVSGCYDSPLTYEYTSFNMRITESLQIENDRRGYQEMCSDCEAFGLQKHGITRSGYIGMTVLAILTISGRRGHKG